MDYRPCTSNGQCHSDARFVNLVCLHLFDYHLEEVIGNDSISPCIAIQIYLKHRNELSTVNSFTVRCLLHLTFEVCTEDECSRLRILLGWDRQL